MKRTLDTKDKFMTVLIMLGLLILLAGFAAFGMGAGKTGVSSAEELQGKVLGGVSNRMPSDSCKILFESILGEKLSGYRSFENTDETLYALRAGKIDSAWFCDVTAQYLLNREDDLKVLETRDPVTDRFAFGMALKNDDRGNALCEEINKAIADIKNDGRLNELLELYGPEGTAENLPKEKDMTVNTDSAYSGKEILYIGVSGNVLPLDMVNEDKDACGFPVAFCDEIGQAIGRRISFVYQSEETMLTALMAGRIDAVMCYGSGNNTVDTGKSYVVTDGYLPMQKYEFVTLQGTDAE